MQKSKLMIIANTLIEELLYGDYDDNFIDRMCAAICEGTPFTEDEIVSQRANEGIEDNIVGGSE